MPPLDLNGEATRRPRHSINGARIVAEPLVIEAVNKGSLERYIVANVKKGRLLIVRFRRHNSFAFRWAADVGPESVTVDCVDRPVKKPGDVTF